MSMTKRVNVQAKVAIRTTKPPIYGNIKDVIMTTSDILKCICMRAIVEEILPDGSTVRLNMKNYFIDNGAGLDARKTAVIAKKEAVKDQKVSKPDVVTNDIANTVAEDGSSTKADKEPEIGSAEASNDVNTNDQVAAETNDGENYNAAILITASEDDNNDVEPHAESVEDKDSEHTTSDDNVESSNADETANDAVETPAASDNKEENKEVKPAAKLNTAKKNTQSKKNSNKKKN